MRFLMMVRPTLTSFYVAPMTATLLGLKIFSSEGRRMGVFVFIDALF